MKKLLIKTEFKKQRKQFLYPQNQTTISIPKLKVFSFLMENRSKDLYLPFSNISSGYDWNQGLNYEKIVASYLTTGFQATSFGLAVAEINKMVLFVRYFYILCTNNFFHSYQNVLSRSQKV